MYTVTYECYFCILSSEKSTFSFRIIFLIIVSAFPSTVKISSQRTISVPSLSSDHNTCKCTDSFHSVFIYLHSQFVLIELIRNSLTV